jgi:hypothetical protein
MEAIMAYIGSTQQHRLKHDQGAADRRKKSEQYAGEPENVTPPRDGCRHIMLNGSKCGKPPEGKVPYCPTHIVEH